MPRGANMPYQPSLENPGTGSAIAGRSGMLRKRFGCPVAMARIRPAESCGCVPVTRAANTAAKMEFADIRRLLHHRAPRTGEYLDNNEPGNFGRSSEAARLGHLCIGDGSDS